MNETLRSQDGSAPVLIAMHFLGGSAREWNEVVELTKPNLRCIGLDLPGFGDAAGKPGYSVAEMAEFCAASLQRIKPQRFVLVGHSMSGKVAMMMARLAAEGDERLSGLEGLVLVASSPPTPEPMEEGKRQKLLLGMSSPGESRRAFAEAYIQENVGTHLPPEVFTQAVDDVLRTNPFAWSAWLESGSREDCSGRIGRLEIPTLILCGEKDADLGQETQRREVIPSLQSVRLEEIAGAGHLLPMEAPRQLVSFLTDFVRDLHQRREATAGIAPRYLELMRSERVSAVTRTVLLDRAVMDDPARGPAALTSGELETLRALASFLLPQDVDGLDLAVRVDTRLARGTGKGWRYADLPPDLQAYKAGLRAFEVEAKTRYGCAFSALGQEDKVAILQIVGLRPNTEEAERPPNNPENSPDLTGPQMIRWLEDLRAELTDFYMSHPATLSRIGYSGIADGARSEALTGFVELGIGKVESWEPQPVLVRLPRR